MKSVLKVITIILAALGVLFIIIMFLPDDEEKEESGQDTTVTVQADGSPGEASEENISAEDVNAEEKEQAAENASGAAAQELSPGKEDNSENDEEDTDEAPAVGNEDSQEAAEAEDTANNNADGNTVQVSIPASEVSDNKMRFKTMSLDEKQITQDIFSGYDLTVVHVWGTYCGPCIAEMGDYAKFYDELPDNVNLVGVICDVYDGIDNNVKAADKILSDAGAGFMNLRTSDDLYDIVGEFRYVPSSFFVDKEGHIIGELMDGASFSDMKSRLDSYLK